MSGPALLLAAAGAAFLCPARIHAETQTVGGSLSRYGAVTPASEDERKAILAELRLRGVVGPRLERWSVAEQAALEDIRKAEKEGALDFLKRESVPLGGLAVPEVTPQGRFQRLTLAGFERYRLVKSQKARRFFEDQGTEAKFIFELRTVLGRRIFDPRGHLSAAGRDLFDRALRGERVQWKDPRRGPMEGALAP